MEDAKASTMRECLALLEQAASALDECARPTMFLGHYEQRDRESAAGALAARIRALLAKGGGK